VTGVAVGPSDIDSRAAFYMNLNIGRLFSWIKRGRHVESRGRSALRFIVAAIAGWNGIAVRASFWMSEKGADALIEFRTDDVLELAGLRVRFEVVNREGVLEKALCKAMAANDVAGALASHGGELRLAIPKRDQT
jgi:hypothetical protein